MSINLILTGQKQRLWKKKKKNLPYLLILFLIPWVSSYTLWSEIMSIICYPGRNRKIQRHDNGLIKIWWGAKTSQSPEEMLLPGKQKLYPKSHTSTLPVCLFLMNHEGIKIRSNSALVNASVLLTWRLLPSKNMFGPSSHYLTPILNCLSHLSAYWTHSF